MDVGERMTPHNQFNDQVREEFRLAMHRYRLVVQSCIDRDVLESGCGVGNGSFLVSAVARSVVAVDNDPEAITFATTYYNNTNLTFMLKDALQPLPQQFDVVLSLDVIEHLPDIPVYLEVLYAQLKPQGLLIISTPNKNVLQLLYPEANRFHVNEMTQQEFISALSVKFHIKHIIGQVIRENKVIKTANLERVRAFVAWCSPKKQDAKSH